MDYYDSAEDLVITQDRALQELARHGITSNEEILEFFNEVGKEKEYDAQEVLVWLGYWGCQIWKFLFGFYSAWC